MQNFGCALKRALLISTLVMPLAACTTFGRAPVNSNELSGVVSDLPGAQGKTIADQRKIDRTVAKSCSGGILDGRQCDLHTKASKTRRAEL